MLDSRGVAYSEINALKHANPDEAKENAEILERLIATERAWIYVRDIGLQSAEHIYARYASGLNV